MTGWVHRLYISSLVGIGFIVFILLAWFGYSYYGTRIEERPFHEYHDFLKPSGAMGHGLGILGTLMILTGVFSYIGRKKKIFLPRVGALKHWLEFHIFLCSVGPLLVLFHTAFKFGGIVSISFWSMVAVVLSGVIGRFIYIQIPRTIHGRELSLSEIREMKDSLSHALRDKYGFDEKTYNSLIAVTQQTFEQKRHSIIGGLLDRRQYNGRIRHEIRDILKQANLAGKDRKGVLKLVNNEMTLNAKIGRLQTMQKLFRYWHVAHLPFALVMLVIMVIHVAITLAFGYRWIF